MRSNARRDPTSGAPEAVHPTRGSSPPRSLPRSSMRDEAYRFPVGADDTTTGTFAGGRAHSGRASHRSVGEPSLALRDEVYSFADTTSRFRSYSASEPSYGPHSSYRWSSAEMSFAQHDRYRLPSPVASDRYSAGHDWSRGGYAAAAPPPRPSLEQLQHQHEQGHMRLQERYMEQQLQLEQRQQRLFEEQLRLQEEQQALLQRRLQARPPHVIPDPPMSPEDIAAASLLAMTGEDSDTTGDAEPSELDDENNPNKKKKSLCKVKGCGKLDKGRGFCKLHGGGKRCRFESCDRAARGSSGYCITHGGGPRCQVAHCPKSARTVGGFCKAHGGGRKCKARNCRRTARGEGDLCSDHADQSSLNAHFMGPYGGPAGGPMAPGMAYPQAHQPAYHQEPSPFTAANPFGYMGGSVMAPPMSAGAYSDSAAAVDRYPPMRGSPPFGLLGAGGPHAPHPAGFIGHAAAPGMHNAASVRL